MKRWLFQGITNIRISSNNHVRLLQLPSAYKQTQTEKMVKLKWLHSSHSCLDLLNWKEILKVISPLTEKMPNKETGKCGSVTGGGLAGSCFVNFLVPTSKMTLSWHWIWSGLRVKYDDHMNPESRVGWTQVRAAVFNERRVRVCMCERGGGGVILVQANRIISPAQIYATCRRPIKQVASLASESRLQLRRLQRSTGHKGLAHTNGICGC